VLVVEEDVSEFFVVAVFVVAVLDEVPLVEPEVVVVLAGAIT
jgi:hypothetical protein